MSNLLLTRVSLAACTMAFLSASSAVVAGQTDVTESADDQGTPASAEPSDGGSAGEVDAAPADDVGDGSGSSGSNAGNYRTGASVNVNPRTGAVEASVQLFRIPGRSAGLDAEFSLTYSSTSRVQSSETTLTAFYLPRGWSISLSNTMPQSGLQNVNIDGQQSYIQDSSWFSQLEGGTKFATGLLQYNRADSNFLPDTSVTVDGITSANVLTTLDGRRRYLSSAGLLLRESNRFGDTIDYTYVGGVDNPVAENLIDTMTDTWGNTVSFDWDSTSSPSAVTITLPDGRTVGYSWNEVGISSVVDEQGKRTVFQYGEFQCDVITPVLTGLTSPTGAVTTIEYQCLDVCKEDASAGESSCSETETWPVAQSLLVCPTNGTDCSVGSTNDQLRTTYQFSTAANPRNYSGYPLLSPFDQLSGIPGSDPVMVKGGATNFTYQSVVRTLRSNGALARMTVSEYDFLHRNTNTWHCVAGPVNPLSNGPCAAIGMAISKQEAHCYTTPDASGNCDESLDVTALPANYQSAKVSGSCVFSVGGVGTDAVRLSSVTRDYNGFGQITRIAKYHGTRDTGISSGGCDVNQLFQPNGGSLQLVSDIYTEYDLPQAPDGDDPFELGAGHYGQLLGHLEFEYLDEDTTGLAAHQALGDGTTPIRVTLACYDLTGLGTTVPANALPASSTVGLLPLTTTAPIAGSVTQCDTPSWQSSVPNPGGGTVPVAPPKTSSFAYDTYGRVTGVKHTWLDGSSTQPGSTQSTTSAVSYTRVGPDTGAEATNCPGGFGTMESVAHTDAEGNTTVVRHCIQNGWVLSTIDADGDRTTIIRDEVGLAKRVIHPNGDYTTADYYYQCPVSPEQVATCPQATCTAADPSICAGCPQGVTGATCVLHGQFTGAGNASFVDGVQHLTIKDGLGRSVATYDNLGASAGGPYTSWQQRSATAFDSIGLRTAQVATIGVAAPLVHSTTTAYNATFQPNLVCDSRGVAHQVVHDNVGLARKHALNGSQHSRQLFNDSMHPIGEDDCPLGADTPTTQSCAATSDGTSTCCPATLSDTTGATCSGLGDIYRSARRVDGSGTSHVATGWHPTATFESGSIAEVSGTIARDALLQKYGYFTRSRTIGDSSLAVSTAATWSRDLNGRPVQHQLSVSNASTAASSDTYDYDGIGRQTLEYSKLGISNPQESYYTATSQLSQLTDYAGITFNSYYDEMKRLVRYCYPAEDGSGSQGRKYTYDSITGHTTSVTHFDSPNDCPSESACPQGACAGSDTDGDSISYTYTRFGALLTKTYSQVTDNQDLCATPLQNGRCITQLSWGYDVYQRPVCFADAVATAGGNTCATTAIAEDFDPSTQLAWRTYWPQNNSFKRGLLKSACRGVLKDAETSTYEAQCTDYDYYTSADSGGGEECPSAATYPQGALAGLLKSREVCVGGSCLDGDGTAVYTQTTGYDSHRRPCSQKSTNANDDVVLASSYVYDQYDNVIHETHESDLPDAVPNDYQQFHQYDGLMRLVCSVKTDSSGQPTQSFQYQYDAFSNITRRVVNTFEDSGEQLSSRNVFSACSERFDDTGGSVGAPTPPGGTTPPVGTAPPGGTGSVGDAMGGGGCSIRVGQTPPIGLFLLTMLGFLARRRSRRRWRCGHNETSGDTDE